MSDVDEPVTPVPPVPKRNGYALFLLIGGLAAIVVGGLIGILSGHAPLLSLLVPSAVEIKPTAGPVVHAEVDGGFISVAGDHVSILAEHVTV